MTANVCSCGAAAEEGAAYCGSCGRRLPPEPRPVAAPAGAAADRATPAAQPPVARPSPVQPAPADEGEQATSSRCCQACKAPWEREFRFCPECGARASHPQPCLKLILHLPDGQRRELLLDGSMVTLGSGLEATLRVSDPFVSKKHCQFAALATGEYQVEDLGSSNGTFVRITGPTPVAPGDWLLMGSTLVAVEKG